MEGMKTILIIALIAMATNAMAINPPGTKKVKIGNETFYVDQNEINIADWLEYVNYTERKFGKNSDEVKTVLPQGVETKESIAKHKLTDPITGISLAQAQEYCKWRSEVVNAVNDETGLGNVQYTIPTEEQYSKLLKLFGSYEILSDKNKTERIVGLRSSVNELTSEGSVLKNNGSFSKEDIIPGNNIGFRCVAIVTKIKK